MNAAIVNYIRFDDRITKMSKNSRERIPKHVIAKMPDVLGLICIGLRIFNEHACACPDYR